MAVVTLAAGKGSPWVTTSALALASAWPAEREPIVADLDISGGAIGSLFGLPSTPGLTSLAAAHGRDGSVDGGLRRHCALLPGGLPALVAPPSPSAVAGAVHVVGAELPHLAAAAGVDVIVDAGRLVIGEGPGRLANGDLIAAADAVVLLTRPTLAGLASLSATLPSVRAALGDAREEAILLVLAGPGGYSAEEIARHFGIPVMGTLPGDASGAAIATGQAGGHLERTRLFRAARALAPDLLTRATVHSASTAAGEAAAESIEVGT